ncbi:MAG: tetratricopeptide repeat protein [Symploca sp. SIO2E6]|nr:tetratricopeptide repeat protein [Symploca sp. SIO2E6]
MPKKKRQKAAQGFGFNAQALEVALAKLEYLMRHQEWSKALKQLQSLEERYPNHPKVLIHLADFCYEIDDTTGYQEASERLVQVDQDNPEAHLRLGEAYLGNVHPLLALRAFRHFLAQFPNHKQMEKVKKIVADLEARSDVIRANMGLEGENTLPLAILHEEATSCFEQGNFTKARQLEEQVLENRPNFTPALNNISLSYWREGNINEAIATANHVIDIDPHNFHAYSNLTRFLCLNGQLAEAIQTAQKLKAIDENVVDFWIKKAEAFSYIGDDQGIVNTFTTVEESGDLDLAPPVFYHLVAAAQMRLGQEKKARQLWQQALETDPEFETAHENLDDLKQPISNRHAPWAFSVANWITQQAIEDLVEITEKPQGKGKKVSYADKIEQYLQKHPEIVTLVPLLLERGDPQGREFALSLAMMAETPAMLEALRNFALSNCGPDEMRQQAAQVASGAGLFPHGKVRMWLRSEWQEVMLMGMEINNEPSRSHQPEVEDLLMEAIDALKYGDPEEAEPLLKQALAIEPDAPDLMFNLANTYEQQKRDQEAYELIQLVHQQHPDYVFAQISLAKFHTKNKDYEAAEALLKPILQRKKFHFQEFALFCQTQIELCLAKKELKGARSWLGTWANVEPDEPAIAYWKRRLRDPSQFIETNSPINLLKNYLSDVE